MLSFVRDEALFIGEFYTLRGRDRDERDDATNATNATNAIGPRGARDLRATVLCLERIIICAIFPDFCDNRQLRLTKYVSYLFIGQSPFSVHSLLQHVASTLTHFI